jgi:hypothetical protein
MHELKTRFVKNLSEESGTGANGKEWRKQTFVTTSDGQFPVNVAFTIWGDKTDLVKNLKQGQEITVKFDVSSREYKDKWYSEIKAFAIEVHGTQAAQPAFSQPAANTAPVDDGLPF